jgi:hypothetical protein
MDPYYVHSPSDKAFGSWTRKKGGKEKAQVTGEAVCIQSKKTCYEAAIQSEAKPTLHAEENSEQKRKSEQRRKIREGAVSCIVSASKRERASRREARESDQTGGRKTQIKRETRYKAAI